MIIYPLFRKNMVYCAMYVYLKHGYIKLLIRKCLYFGAIFNLNKVVDTSCKDVGQVFVGGNCEKGDFRVESVVLSSLCCQCIVRNARAAT